MENNNTTTTLTISMTVSTETAEQIKNIRFSDGPKNQKLLKKAFDEARENGSDINNDLGWFIERFTSLEAVYMYKQQTWYEFLIDVITSELSNYDYEELSNIDDTDVLVEKVMTQYLVDGTYTYNTHRSRALLFNFGEYIDTDLMSEFNIDPIARPELYLVELMNQTMIWMFNQIDLADISKLDELVEALQEVE